MKDKDNDLCFRLWMRGFTLILVILLSGCFIFLTVGVVKKIINMEIVTSE